MTHQRLRHCPFSQKEDQMLQSLVNVHGTDSWPVVAQHMVRRSARQCRERWNVLEKRQRSARPFTPEEDNLLITECMKIGPKWKILEAFFVDRTSICLKNRWQILLAEFNKEKPTTSKQPDLTLDDDDFLKDDHTMDSLNFLWEDMDM